MATPLARVRRRRPAWHNGEAMSGEARDSSEAAVQIRWTPLSSLVARAPWLIAALPISAGLVVMLARMRHAALGWLETPAEVALWAFILLPMLLLVRWKGTLAVSSDRVVLIRGRSRRVIDLPSGGVPAAKFTQPRLGVRGSVFFMGPLKVGAELLLEPNDYTRQPCAKVDVWAEEGPARALYDRLRALGVLESSRAERGYRQAEAPHVLSFELAPAESTPVARTMVVWFGVLVTAVVAGYFATDFTHSGMAIVSATLITLVVGVLAVIAIDRRRAPALELKLRDGVVDLVRARGGDVIASSSVARVRATPGRAVMRGDQPTECMTLDLGIGQREAVRVGCWGSPLRWTEAAPEGRWPEYNVGTVEWPKLLEVLGLADRAH